METNKILSASFIDILFEGRNKNYGAYELRKKYGHRLYYAIVVTIVFAALVVFASFVSARFEKQERAGPLQIDTVTLVDVFKDEPVVPPPPPPPPAVEPPRIATSIYTAPRLVNEEIRPEEEMKEITELANTKIGTANVDGLKETGITAPPIEEPKSGVITGPKKEEEDQPFIIVQIQAKFPGGDEEWRKYISRQINRNIDELEEEGKAGTCIVQFVVDKEGNISDVEALTMQGTKLAEICINAVRKGPNWTPAENNGKKVKAYRKQPVTFQINN